MNLRALIACNQEILLKVNKSRSDLSYRGVTGIPKNNLGLNMNPIYERSIFSSVGVKTVRKSTPQNASVLAAGSTEVEFYTSSTLESKTFPPIPVVPKLLTQLVLEEEKMVKKTALSNINNDLYYSGRPMTNLGQSVTSDLQDYVKYMERSFYLSDDVLVIFLLCLKEHLQDVQIWLGSVEEWINQVVDIKIFTESAFQRQIDALQAAAILAGNNQRNNGAEIRSNCQHTFEGHFNKDRLCRTPTQTQSFASSKIGLPVTLLTTTISGPALDGSFDLLTKVGQTKFNAFIPYMNA